MGSINDTNMDGTLISELRYFSRQLVREWGFMSSEVAGTSYTTSAVHVLIEISHNEGLMSADLCAPLNLDKSSVSRVVKKLVDAGELEENFDGGAAGKGDGRIKRLALTQKGKETIRGVNEYGNHQVSSALSKLPPTTSPTQILTGITAYATALRSSRLNVPPSTPPLITTQPPSSPPQIQILSGYQPSLISSSLHLHTTYYIPTLADGSIFEPELSREMAELVPRLDGLTSQAWVAVSSPPSLSSSPEIVGCVWIDGLYTPKNGNQNHSPKSQPPPQPHPQPHPQTQNTERKRIARLRFFIVSPNMQGKGIGKKLIEAATGFCDENGYDEVHLWTFKGLDVARGLYEKVGFRVVSEEWKENWGRKLLLQCFVRVRGGGEV